MTGAGDYAVIQAKRKALIDAIKPDLVTKKQPLLMQYDQLDANGSEIAETLMIQAVYESGLEGDGSGNAYNEKVAINFTSYLPYLQQQGEHGTALGYQTALANANYLVMRSSAGVWSVLSTSISSAVYEVHKASKGGVYIGGAFTNLTDANGDYISKWNGTAFSSLASGLSSNAQKMIEAPDGTLYVVGDFENAGGDANADRFAKWNGTAFSAVGAGLNFTAYDIARANDGTLYIVGDFYNVGDANGDYVLHWTGSAWESLGTGLSHPALAVCIAKDGSVYVGGIFSFAGGVSGTS